MKTAIIAMITLLAFAVFGKPVSTAWETKPHTHKHGIAYRCPHCHQTWGNIPPNLKAWETKHLLKVRRDMITLHMREVHGKRI